MSVSVKNQTETHWKIGIQEKIKIQGKVKDQTKISKNVRISIGRDSKLIRDLISNDKSDDSGIGSDLGDLTEKDLTDKDFKNFDFRLIECNTNLELLSRFYFNRKDRSFLSRFKSSFLSRFYPNDKFEDNELLELAKNLDYLDSSLLKEVLYSISNKKLNYSSLNENLIRIIENGSFIQVSFGAYHVSAIRDNGNVVTWEGNNCKQSENIPLPGVKYHREKNSMEGSSRGFFRRLFARMDSGKRNTCKFVQIACGESHTSALADDGSVVTWGSNDGGQYDNIPSFPSNPFVNGFDEGREKKFIQIACGKYHTSAIRDDGSLVTWGNNRSGQYKNIPLTGKFFEIACGSNHTSAIRDDGNVVTWGSNSEDQYINLPVVDANNGRFIKIACGSYHTSGIRDDGTVVTWGDGRYEQYRNLPFHQRFIDIACGDVHTSAIRDDGGVVTWGGNNNWQYSNIPSNFSDSSGDKSEKRAGGKFIRIACGLFHTSAIKDDGTVVTWGDNQYGQNYNIPHSSNEGKDDEKDEKEKRNNSRFIEIVCGDFHTSAIKEDGTVVNWGNNTFGRDKGLLFLFSAKSNLKKRRTQMR